MCAAAACVATVALAAAAPPEGDLVPIPGGSFESVLPPAPGLKQVSVAAFRLDRTPVTNEQFARFVLRHRQWGRDRVAAIFADAGYLQHWQSAVKPVAGTGQQPVVHVSWFAATAFCESRGGRLPTWYEWEYVSAASDTLPDGRPDPLWRQRILDWYSRPAAASLPDVGLTEPNFYRVRDLHGVIWEWVGDVSAMLVSADNREQSEPDKLRFCGPGALTMEQKENYATLMRIAMLSSMQARYTSATMGFRCAASMGTAP